jgi:hypothetical protein
MMKILRLIAVLGLAFNGVAVSASEDPACAQLDHTFQSYTAGQLRAIAGTCDDKSVARLFYNRAYHKDLLSEGRALSGIITSNAEPDGYHVTSYRLYIALVEELSFQWFPEPNARVAFLNKVYERRGEVIELRLHGYDRLADALDSKYLN